MRLTPGSMVVRLLPVLALALGCASANKLA
jgi:hypothetical protein